MSRSGQIVVYILPKEAAIVTILAVSDISNQQGLHEVDSPSGPCGRSRKSAVGKDGPNGFRPG